MTPVEPHPQLRKLPAQNCDRLNRLTPALDSLVTGSPGRTRSAAHCTDGATMLSPHAPLAYKCEDRGQCAHEIGHAGSNATFVDTPAPHSENNDEITFELTRNSQISRQGLRFSCHKQT